MKLPADLFKAYDIRGLVGSELTPQIAKAVGRALADYLTEPGPIVVGRDMRPDSAALAKALIEGITLQGRDVWDIGLVSTDLVYFAAGRFDQVAGGSVVTASHNPGSYNGIKLVGHGAVPMGREHGLQSIKSLVEADAFRAAPSPGQVRQRSVLPEFTQQTVKFAGLDMKPFKLAVDAGNGMAGAIWPAVEKALPFRAKHLYFELDGTFPNHLANPHLHETLAELIKTIEAEKLDVGIAFDGDGDRGGLVDETGAVVPEAIVGAILADELLRQNPGAAVVCDVRTSQIVRATVEAAGGRYIRSKVGGDDIKGLMREHEAVLGIELSGHYYFRDNYYSDSGLLAVVMVLGILSRSGRKLSELVARYRVYATADEQNLEVADKAATIARLKQAFADADQNELDGLTVTYPDWWFNVRPSNTESYLRLNVEANDQATLETALKRLRGAIG